VGVKKKGGEMITGTEREGEEGEKRKEQGGGVGRGCVEDEVEGGGGGEV